jgi:hypothetical protein
MILKIPPALLFQRGELDILFHAHSLITAEIILSGIIRPKIIALTHSHR